MMNTCMSKGINRGLRAWDVGSALTTFNKGNVNLSPKVIAHRSSATRREMLVNPPAYAQFCHKANINDQVRAPGVQHLSTEVWYHPRC